MAEISFELPSALTARATYEWAEETDNYYWAVVVYFGSAHVATVPYTFSDGSVCVGAQNMPSAVEVDEFVAERLKGLFQ